MGKKPEECRMQTLAKSATTHVQHCVHCNCVAVHVGPVTLRFDAGAAESLWNTLGQALVRLELELSSAEEPALSMSYGAKPHGVS
jgi:hypothetical protein